MLSDMKFSLRYLLLEVTLIAICLGLYRYESTWIMGENVYLHVAEMTVMSTLMIVSFSAAVGGLFFRPVRGAVVGLILSLILVPLAVWGSLG